MKKYMSWMGIAALICVFFMGMNTLMKQKNSTEKMEGVEAYMQSRYPGEEFIFSGVHTGGRGAYSLVSPKGEPEETFRVFAGKDEKTFEDTYYTLTLRKAVKDEAESLVQRVFKTAYVLPKVYQLAQGETLEPYPSLQAYTKKSSANIDLRVVVDESEAAAFTQVNIEKALAALAERFACETVVFSLAKPGKMDAVRGMTYAKADSSQKEWAENSVKARIHTDGSYQLR